MFMSQDTRIKPGQHLSKATEFKPGQHWRQPAPWWKREWLWNEYIDKGKSASEIALGRNVTPGAILFWIKKHGIPTRTTAQVRAVKHWGATGERNPMFGKRGILNPLWKGGLTPARQRIYARSEWKALLRDLRKRDKCCRLCGATGKLVVHHIEPFSNAPLLVLDIGNVIRLCEPCHHKITRKELRWRKRLYRIIESERR